MIFKDTSTLQYCIQILSLKNSSSRSVSLRGFENKSFSKTILACYKGPRWVSFNGKKAKKISWHCHFKQLCSNDYYQYKYHALPIDYEYLYHDILVLMLKNTSTSKYQ